jgi:hypothetical protein
MRRSDEKPETLSFADVELELQSPASGGEDARAARWRAAGGGGLNDEFDAKRSWFDRFSLAVPSQVHDG